MCSRPCVTWTGVTRLPGTALKQACPVQPRRYRRLKPDPTAKELEEVYTPTAAEIAFAKHLTTQPGPELAVLIHLKLFQRLGYFTVLAEVPERIRKQRLGRPSPQFSLLGLQPRASILAGCVRTRLVGFFRRLGLVCAAR